MKANSYSRFVLFSILLFWDGGGQGGGGKQCKGTEHGNGTGRQREGASPRVGVIILISDTLYHPYEHCYNFYEAIPFCTKFWAITSFFGLADETSN